MVNPTGYTALDLIGFTDRGTYATNVAYVKNDLVHYAGNIWRCLIDDTMNVTPAEGNNWTVWVGEPTSLVERIIAPLEENPATVAYATGRQIIYDDWLWEVIDDIAVGDVLIDYDVDPTNANIKKAAPVETQLLDIKAKVGPLASLATTIKTSIVAAINEIVGKIGNLSLLGTTDKTSAVNAINEVNTKVSKTEDLISNSGDAYDSTKAYAVGDLCIYNNVLYRCITACSAGSWATNQSCFTADTLTGVLSKTGIKIYEFTITLDAYSRFYISPSDVIASKHIINADFTPLSQNNLYTSTFIRYTQSGGNYYGDILVLKTNSATFELVPNTVGNLRIYYID